jgi:predicted Zn-dependent peptidase
MIACLFAIAALLLAGAVPSSAGESHSRLSPFPAVDIQELVLDNGFRVLVVEDHRVPRVAASLWYRVGSMIEPQGEHNSAHFLEHMVFQGTTSVGTTDFSAERSILREIHETEQELIKVWNRERNRLRERDVFYDELDWPTTPKIDELRQRLYELEDEDSNYREFWAEYKWYKGCGGLMRHTDPVPATTYKEHIEIDVDLPKENLELLFRLEADRMVNAVFRGWEAQRFTVLEQRLNRQSRAATRFDYEAMDGVTFLASPVAHPAGGHFRDFVYFSRDTMLRIYDDYFVPNNARLALVGDITLAEVRPLAERYFGRVPRGPEPPARMDMEAEPPPGGAIRLDWKEPLEPRVFVRYRIPGVGHPDRPLFDTIGALLRGSHGMPAELLEMDTTRATPQVDFGVSVPRIGVPYVINIIGSGRRDEDLPAVERAILRAVDNLRQGRFGERELERARKYLRREWENLRSERGSLAHLLGSFDVMDNWQVLLQQMQSRETASAEDIQRVAKRYLVPFNRVIATSRQQPSAQAVAFTNSPTSK